MWLTNTLQASLIVYFYPERWMNEGNAAGVAELKAHAERKVFRPWTWFAQTLPQTFRRHFRAFLFSFALMVAGAVFGGLALNLDRTAKQVIMPFSHLQQTPSQRVAKEEHAKKNHLEGHYATFAGTLMHNNIKVTFMALALGLSYGVGTIIIMFYNGVILGAVVIDYIADGQTTFLLGWLLPHGVVEIPAMLIGGQAGFVLATSLLRRSDGRPLHIRIRAATSDVVTLAFGAALLLVWAGVIESFLSQHHEPTLPYWVKITFGVIELCALSCFLLWAGTSTPGSEQKAKAAA